jgi:hypothetical protein
MLAAFTGITPMAAEGIPVVAIDAVGDLHLVGYTRVAGA